MALVYLAYAAEDKDFAAHLSEDLNQAAIQTLHNTDATELLPEQATHILHILSNAALLDEHFLSTLEFAKENRLERLALRLTEIETMPPQLVGVLPLDFSNPEDYQDGLTTLIEDLKIEQVAPISQLPKEIIQLLNSPSSPDRKMGIEILAKYRTKDEVLRQVALNELEALSFRERDSALKALLRVTIQTFSVQELPTEPILPSKEALEIQARESAQSVIPAHEGKGAIGQSFEQSEGEAHQRYLWQHSPERWFGLIISMAVGVGLISFAASGQWAYLIPITMVGMVLAYFNILIRQNGTLAWETPKPLFGNSIVGMIVAVLIAFILMAALELNGTFLLVNLILGVGFGLFVGWLSAVKL